MVTVAHEASGWNWWTRGRFTTVKQLTSQAIPGKDSTPPTADIGAVTTQDCDSLPPSECTEHTYSFSLPGMNDNFPQQITPPAIAAAAIGAAECHVVPLAVVIDQNYNQDNSCDIKENMTANDAALPASSSWFRWWLYSPQLNPKTPPSDGNTAHEGQALTTSRAANRRGTDISHIPEGPHTVVLPAHCESGEAVKPAGGETQREGFLPATATSWLGWWGGRPLLNAVSDRPMQSSQANYEAGNDGVQNTLESHAAPSHNSTAPLSLPQTISSATTVKGQDALEISSTRGSSWIFWSRGRENTTTEAGSDVNRPNPIADEVSNARPPSESNLPATKSLITNKSATGDSGDKVKTTKADNIAVAQQVQQVQQAIPENSTLPVQSPAPEAAQKKASPHHLFPSFDSCYQRFQAPSLLCQVMKTFRPAKPIAAKHLFITQYPPTIRKAVAIGVHGFFPTRIVRTVLGEPTGTSVRFAEGAASAIYRWAELNNIEVEVEKVALEGEGKVADRVEILWKLLKNWMDHVQSADFVLIAAHSQGVVVGIQLLARMIEEGCVDKARVGFIAMAGINLGPFCHLPTSILTGSAKELFEFQKPESSPSKKYIQALRVVLAHHVRILFVGSIDDQLVSLESSTFSNIHHPYIYRAVFVDGRIHAPDFLNHVVGFAMKLRNLGISDHGLIRELSSPLAGSLYASEGHSCIYNDNAVYDLGLRHSLETTSFPDVPLRVDRFELPTSNNNPFFLPWSMRGLLEDPYVRLHFENEKKDLLDEFEKWQPTSKPLKDVKFRLEGVRSML